MLKKGIFCLLILVSAISLFSCGGGSANLSEKTIEQIKDAFEKEGYTVGDETLQGFTAVVAYKLTDVIQVIIFPSSDLATETKPTYDTAALAVGQTCKQDKNIVYYGTEAAIAVFDNIGSSDNNGNDNNPGSTEVSTLTVSDISNAFINAKYEVTTEEIGGLVILDADSGTNYIKVVIFRTVALAIKSKPSYDTAALELGVKCKQNKNIIYYGSSPAITIFELLSVGK